VPPEAASLDVSAPLPDSSIQDKALERAMLRISEPLYQTMVRVLSLTLLVCGKKACSSTGVT
jgi:hypothetical protein